MNRVLRCRRMAGCTLAFIVTLAGCTRTPTGAQRGVLPRALTPSETRVVSSGNLFSLKLYRAHAAEVGAENIFLSPLSASMALGMTLNGANGETHTAMQQALELSGLTEAEINEAYRSLIDLLTGLDPKVTFEIANSIWYRDGFNIAPDFVATNQTCFDAVIQALDFSAASAAPTINAWVAEKTHEKITEIITPPIEPDTVMFLINALYFLGDWTWQFDPDLTDERPFHNLDGSTSQVPAMRLGDADLRYYADEMLQMVELPYGDSLFCMDVIMPVGLMSLTEFVDGLDRDTWQALVNALQTRTVDLLQFPRFILEYEFTLNDVLTALGMGIAFTGSADFERMRTGGPGGLLISRVKQKAFVDVDEEGTEAAAVTVVEIALTSVTPSLNIYIDRPFLFVIREQASGTILFMGQVTGF